MKCFFLIVDQEAIEDLISALDDYTALLEALEHDEEPTSFFETTELETYRRELDELRETWLEVLRRQAVEEELEEEEGEESGGSSIIRSDLERIRLELLEMSDRLESFADELKGGI